MAEARNSDFMRAVNDGDPVRVADLLPEVPARGAHFSDPVKMAEMQEKRALTYEERRETQRSTAADRRQRAAEEVTAAVDDAIESDMFAGKTNEELADLITYRMAKITLIGGELFAPTSLKEVTETATAWAKVATAEANRRRGKLPNEAELSPVEDLAEKLRKLKAVATKRARTAS